MAFPSAAAAADGELPPKAERRFDAPALAVLSRVFAREAALQVAQAGVRWIVGAGGASGAEIPALERDLDLPGVYRAQAGLIEDMGRIADVLYDRVRA